MQSRNHSIMRVMFVLAAVAGLLAGCANQPNQPNPQPTISDANNTAIQPTLTSLPGTISPVMEAVAGTPTPPPTPEPATPLPTASSTPLAQPTFAQMTQGGCCVQPFFSPDGSRILYLDKPSADAHTGLWSVTVTQPLAPPMLYTQRLGPFSRDFSLNEFLEGGRTIVERMSDGTQWTIDNGGRRILFSPDDQRIAWTVGEEVGNFDVRRSDIWLADLDGSNARRVATLYGGGIQAWFNDSSRMLVIGKANRSDAVPALSILSLADGSLTQLIDVERSRSMLLSPDDRRIVYYVSQASDATQDGMYLLDLSATPAIPQRLDFFGAYRWCSPTALYYIPLQTSAPSNELWRLDVTTGQARALIPAGTDSPFKIGNGDWDVSPDGRQIVYLNARDRNIWLVTLPEAC